MTRRISVVTSVATLAWEGRAQRWLPLSAHMVVPSPTAQPRPRPRPLPLLSCGRTLRSANIRPATMPAFFHPPWRKIGPAPPVNRGFLYCTLMHPTYKHAARPVAATPARARRALPRARQPPFQCSSPATVARAWIALAAPPHGHQRCAPPSSSRAQFPPLHAIQHTLALSQAAQRVHRADNVCMRHSDSCLPSSWKRPLVCSILALFA